MAMSPEPGGGHPTLAFDTTWLDWAFLLDLLGIAGYLFALMLTHRCVAGNYSSLLTACAHPSNRAL